jgi:redox-sensitive bicupin YhaK (pirin superfamily)
MTAASGVVHEEKHSAEFARHGGIFQMLQLWVNLPAKDKKLPPRYQELLASAIPSVSVGNASVRVIAGSFNGAAGPAKTFTSMTVLDAQIPARSTVNVPLPSGHSALVTVLEGQITTEGQTVNPADLAVFEHEGDAIEITATQDAKVVVLSGEPIDEPIAAYGPFVMNTQEEIQEAFEEYRTGKMGHLVAKTG